jgi:hypothetical protein
MEKFFIASAIIHLCAIFVFKLLRLTSIKINSDEFTFELVILLKACKWTHFLILQQLFDYDLSLVFATKYVLHGMSTENYLEIAAFIVTNLLICA